VKASSILIHQWYNFAGLPVSWPSAVN
jgi:hypothetical protein